MKKGLIILCIILLFIPTYISVLYYISIQGDPIETRNLDQITVEAPDGKKLDSDEEGEEWLLDFFTNIRNEAVDTTTLPTSYESKPYFKVTYSSYGNKYSFRYYFTSNPSACYFLDREDVCHRVPSKYAERFIKEAIAECVYDSAVPPVMTIGAAVVEPQSLSWKYLPYGATEFVDSTRSVSGGYTISEVGSVSSDFSYMFDIDPTSVDVVVSSAEDSSYVLYSGSFAGLKDNLEVKESIKVNITFSATWDSEAFKGNGSYVVSGTVFAPAEFTLSANSVKCGQFVVIRGVNVLDVRDIDFSISPSINFVPTFFDLGNSEVAALVPIDIDLGNENCIYNISIRSGNSTTDLMLDVQARTQSINTISGITAEDVGTMDLSTNFYANIYSNIKAEISNYTDYGKLYHTSPFIKPCDVPDKYIRSSFGSFSRYQSFNSTLYLNRDYFYAGQYSLKAIGDGKVVYIGSQPYTGALIIIDHGYGLLSWYCNVGEVDVSIGSEIKQGEVIGKNKGGGGFCWKYNGECSSVHTAATIYGVPIDMSQLWNEGIPALASAK